MGGSVTRDQATSTSSLSALSIEAGTNQERSREIQATQQHQYGVSPEVHTQSTTAVLLSGYIVNYLSLKLNYLTIRTSFLSPK